MGNSYRGKEKKSKKQQLTEEIERLKRKNSELKDKVCSQAERLSDMQQMRAEDELAIKELQEDHAISRKKLCDAENNLAKAHERIERLIDALGKVDKHGEEGQARVIAELEQRLKGVETQRDQYRDTLERERNIKVLATEAVEQERKKFARICERMLPQAGGRDSDMGRVLLKAARKLRDGEDIKPIDRRLPDAKATKAMYDAVNPEPDKVGGGILGNKGGVLR